MTVNVTDTVGANNTIVLDGNSKIPAIDGSQVTALSATAFTTGTLATARIDVGTTAGKVLQLDGSARIPALSGANLTNVPGPTSSTSDPAIDTNPTLGKKWINKTSGEVYICTDATAGANVWTNLGAGTGDVQPWTYQGSNYGYNAGGARQNPDHGNCLNTIDRFAFASTANAVDVGDLTVAQFNTVGNSSASYSFSSGGYSTGGYNYQNKIEKYANASTANATDIANLTENKGDSTMGSSSPTHGFIAGVRLGNTAPYNPDVTIEKFSTVSDANAVDHGDLHTATWYGGGHSTVTHGFTSGHSNNASPYYINNIQRYAFASNTTATDWANTTIATNPYSGQGGSSSTTNGYAYFGGTGVSVIDKFPFASQTNASDIGDLSVHRWYGTGGHSSTTYGYSSGGWTGNPNVQNVIDKVSFATDGNATDVGDLTVARKQQAGANY